MKTYAAIFLLVYSLSAWAGELRPSFAGADFPGRASGHFIRAGALASLELKWGRDSMDQVWLQISYRGKPVAKFVNEQVRLQGLCVDEQSGLEQLVISDWSGGNGDAGRYHYLYWDAPHQRFSKAVFDKESDDQSHEAGGHCLWNSRAQRGKKHNANIGWAVFGQIRPAEHPVELASLDHPNKPSPVRLATRSIPGARIEEIGARLDRLKDDRFSMRAVAGDANWEILSVQFEQVCNSWGVLLARKRTARDWKAFYSVPAGCSRITLGAVEDRGLKGAQWRVGLSEDNEAPQEYLIDLERMTILLVGNTI